MVPTTANRINNILTKSCLPMTFLSILLARIATYSFCSKYVVKRMQNNFVNSTLEMSHQVDFSETQSFLRKGKITEASAAVVKNEYSVHNQYYLNYLFPKNYFAILFSILLLND